MVFRSHPRWVALVLCLFFARIGWAQNAPATQPTGVEAILPRLADDATRKQAIDELCHSADMRLVGFFEAYGQGSAYLYNGQVVLGLTTTTLGDEKATPLVNPLTREPLLDADHKPLVVPIKSLKEVSVSRKDRVFVRDAVNLLKLSDPDPQARLSAVIKSGDSGSEGNIKTLVELQKSEKDAKVRRAISESLALLNLTRTAPLTDADSNNAHLEAAKELGDLASSRAQPRLEEMLKASKDPARSAAYQKSIGQIESWRTKAQWISNLFSGLSAGSILVLVALGLSIIFGVMGVINMAQGELVMIGCYATYLTQLAFQHWLPESMFDWYFVLAIPVSFIASALVGMLIEVTVVRRLYGRPLDTLLATIGVGYILTQFIRSRFGDNIGIKAPSWLQGGWEVAPDIVLPYARLFAIAYCAACIGLVYLVINKTKLGLLLRATTQGRPMAGALGVPTKRIDLYTFALGAGLAGLAGCAVTSIEGVTPDMGKNYIIDSFLVVVTGGVGKLAGTILSGFGLGMLNKLLEPAVQAVWAYVLTLLFVIIFIQFKPSGLFPAKGRLADV